MVQPLDADSLLARTLLEAGSHFGADDNLEIDYLDKNSQLEESLGDEEEDEVDNEEIIVFSSPPPTIMNK